MEAFRNESLFYRLLPVLNEKLSAKTTNKAGKSSFKSQNTAINMTKVHKFILAHLVSMRL